MKFQFFFLFIICGFFSCNDDPIVEEPTKDPILRNAKMEVNVTYCVDVLCNVEQPLTSVNVYLYDRDPIKFPDVASILNSKATDENGIVDFSAVHDSLVYLSIDHGGDNYLEKIIISQNSTSYHFPRFSAFCDLDGTVLTNCDLKINFQNMSVNQRSKYNVHNIDLMNNDFDRLPNDQILVVTVKEDLGNNQWLISEKFESNGTDDITPYYYEEETIENVWEITDSYFKILGTKVSNLVPDYYFGVSEWEYSLSPTNNLCSTIGWGIQECAENNGIGHIEQEFINGVKYDYLNILYRDASGLDGPAGGIYYSKENGIAHSYIYNKPWIPTGVGLDLID